MAKRHIPPAEGAGVRLRLLEESDLPKTRAWRNQEHIRVWFNNPEPLSESIHKEWFRKYSICDTDFTFVIEMLEPNLPVGQLAIYDVDWARHEAEYGRCIIGEAQAAGKNLLFHASKLLFDIARREMNLNRLHLNVKKDNQKAIHIYKKLGFSTFKEQGPSLFMEVKL